jgi:hypothetical protein
MCGGASQQQNQISDEEKQFYETLTQQYNTVFGQNQAITGALTSTFQPILAAGPGQSGFTPSETNALQTQNIENVATDYAQAQKATADVLAARGGGNTFLPSSVDANLIARNANLAAQSRAQGQNQITQANYAQGNQNFLTAANVLGSTAGLLNPTGYAGSATNAGNSAANEANAITTQNNSLWNSVIGSLGGIAGQAASGFTGGLSKLLPTASAASPAGYMPGLAAASG